MGEQNHILAVAFAAVTVVALGALPGHQHTSWRRVGGAVRRRLGAVRAARGDSSAMNDVTSWCDDVVALLRAGMPTARAWQDAVLRTEQQVMAQWYETFRREAVTESAVITQLLLAGKSYQSQWARFVLWAGVAMTVAHGLGASVATVLERFIVTSEQQQQAQAATREALAGPRATVAVMSALPLVGLVGAQACGLPVLQFLVTTTVGQVCLVAGVFAVCCGAGSAWWLTRRYLGHADERFRAQQMAVLDVMSVGLASGASPDRVLQVLQHTIDDAAAAPRSAQSRVGSVVFSPLREELKAIVDSRVWGGSWADLVEARRSASPPASRKRLSASGTPEGVTGELLAVLSMAERTGASVSHLLHRRAQRVLAQGVAHRRERAAKLGVYVVVPLGAGVLPAFVAWVLVPIVWTVAQQWSVA